MAVPRPHVEPPLVREIVLFQVTCGINGQSVDGPNCAMEEVYRKSVGDLLTIIIIMIINLTILLLLMYKINVQLEKNLFLEK